MKNVPFSVNFLIIYSNEQTPMSRKFFAEKNFLQLAYNVWLPDVVADLATEISPLAQNENSKKERTIYRKTAIAFDSG